MIINLWSTPRVGSIWYSMHLAQENNCKRITEMFNPFHMVDHYRTIKDGVVTNFGHYDPANNSCYDDYFLDDNNMLQHRFVYAQREKTYKEELECRKKMIFNLNPDNNLLFHNHVEPIDHEIRDYLTSIADKNVYIYRRDRRAQLASYAIAFTSKNFGKFKDVHVEYEPIEHIPHLAMEKLVERIKVWDALEKHGETIAYEDIEFYNKQGMVYKQIPDYTQILTPTALAEIDQLLYEFENNKTINPDKI